MTVTQEQILESTPPDYRWRLNQSERPKQQDVLLRLQPTLAAITHVHDATEQILKANEMGKSDVYRYLNEPISLQSQMNDKEYKKRELAAQAHHVFEVCSTTLALKIALLQHDLPDRTFAYQMGTGFPLPEENENVQKLRDKQGDEVVFEFGKPPLDFFLSPGVAGHTDAKVHVYKVRGENGGEATLLALDAREHGYSRTKDPWAHLNLAIAPRVLKGAGVETSLVIFASGFDTVPRNIEEDVPDVGDYGYILSCSDLSGVSAVTHPGVGDQTIVGSLFGGSFRETVGRRSQDYFIAMMEKAIQETYPEGKYQIQVEKEDSTVETQIISIPRRHPALFYDCSSTPDFENMQDWAAAREKTDVILATPEVLPESTLDLIPSGHIATAHGMAATSELAAYHQYQPEIGGVISVFDRPLPILAIAGCTDAVDPRPEGQSHHISHEQVQQQGKRSAQFIAPVISNYFKNLADSPVYTTEQYFGDFAVV